MNNNKNNDISRSKENKSSLNLSNIKYKDGYILKDAANSNPGIGLWAIKTPIEEEIKLDIKEESKNLINNNTNNKNTFNDEELNYKYTKFYNYEEDKKQSFVSEQWRSDLLYLLY